MTAFSLKWFAEEIVAYSA